MPKKDNDFPATHLMYDKGKDAFFRYTVYNDDYTDESPPKTLIFKKPCTSNFLEELARIGLGIECLHIFAYRNNN